MPPDREIAELAQRVEALSDELADSRAERQRLVRELTQRSRSQADAREAIVSLEERLANQERQFTGAGPSANALAATIRELDRELGARLAELGATTSELEALRVSAARREQELTDQIDAADEQLVRARAELSDVKAVLTTARGEQVRAESALTSEAAKAAAATRALAAAEARADLLTAEVARGREELAGLREALELERRTRASMQARFDAQGRELRARDAELAAARRTADRHHVALTRTQGERDALVQERDALAKERRKYIDERDEVEAKRKELAGKLRSAEEQAERAEQRAERAEATAAARAREHQQLIGELGLRLGDVREDVERIGTSRAWRWGHRITRSLRLMTFRKPITEGAVTRAMTRLDEVGAAIGAPPAALGKATPRPSRTKPAAREADDSDDSHHATAPDPGARKELARLIRSRLGDAPKLSDWPRVSIVVVNRNGANHLRSLLRGLREATDYPDFELIVVDNASTDDSVELLRSASEPFAIQVIVNETNESFSDANNTGAKAASSEFLLFLNNDVEPFESGWLRELVAAYRQGVGAVGATLLHSEGREPAGAPRYAVQHRGIRFQAEGHFGRPYNVGGDDPAGPQLGKTEEVPAVTAACLLMRSKVFSSIGGFSGGYRYGTEDVDLGLKLQSVGRRVICSGRSVLLHHESATQEVEGRDFMRANRTVNRRLLLERWGPRLARERALDRIDGGGFWSSGDQLHIAITRTSNDVTDGWGDWYTAQELGDALTERGVRVTYVQRKGDAWYDLPADVDYLLMLMDVYDLPRAGDVPAVAWVRNWTERWLDHDWFDRLHLVLTSSGISGKLIERATGRVAPLFPLATNPARFKPLAEEPALAADYVFTGNHWGVARDIEHAVEPRRGERFRIYGKGWEDTDTVAMYAKGMAAYDQLPAIYSSAKVVLDDTAGPTLPYGAVNCRVFDALASGTVVLTNCAAGVRELFDDEFPVWESRDSMRRELDRLLSDDTARAALAERYRAKVLAEHTYERRAEQLLDHLRARAEALSFCIKIGAPDWEQAQRWGDLYFAHALRRGLERAGHPTTIQVLPEWEEPAGLAHDIVLVLRGLSRYRPKPGQFNVMWLISHPEDVTPAECDGYDLVAVASERFASELRGRTSTPVIVLEQATDPEIFFPEDDDRFEHDVVYVGNSRNVMRKGVADMLALGREVAVYGANWERLIDSRHVVAEHVPNVDLHRVYASAHVVLNDHWDDMRAHGFVSNRVFDVLASGGLLVSDPLPELERFGDAVLTYETAEELDALLARLLADPAECARRRAAGRDVVLAGHTFEHRAATLLDAVSAEMERAGFRSRIASASAAPTRAQTLRTR